MLFATTFVNLLASTWPNKPTQINPIVKMNTQYQLYSRESCHLCHDMHEDLRLWQTRIDFEFEVIDIDEHPQFKEKYNTMIPALTTTQGELLCFGRLDPLVLQQA